MNRLSKKERTTLRTLRRRVLKADVQATDSRRDSGAHIAFLVAQDSFFAFRYKAAQRLGFSHPTTDPTLFLRIVAGNKLDVARRISEARHNTDSPLFRIYARR